MKLYNCPDCIMDDCEGCPRLIVGHKLRVRPAYNPRDYKGQQLFSEYVFL